ncbi:DUF4351 domain-containing protein [Candidatus Chloroploca asiatica]|uniref:DUF4351 domain-containing protein n=1 Tax=Candidatus Chloroploca asiatica TaxID=1506545 RepID=A0A2H3KGH2_9CHLR|nr:DUF4351 domain-containing protein [Candidatus Chloroploca asiatica]PDV96813.1 hypothetical protein A9Q02_20255 [Candidatus Chloroploca asiatica]
MALDHDGIFKQLLSTFLVEFLDLFAPDILALLDPDTLTLLAPESFVDLLDPDRRTADLVVQAQGREGMATFLIHLEHQAQRDAQLPRRMFRYFARFYDRYDRPIYPIALCSYPSPRRLAPHRHEVTLGHHEVLRFEYLMIQLNQLDWRAYLSSTNPLAAALMARMRIAREERWQVKAACLRMLAGVPMTAAQRRMLAAFVSIYLPLNGDETRRFEAEVATWQTPIQEAVVELITEWELKGRQEGRQEERQTLLLRQLTRKLEPLPEGTRREVLALTPEQLLILSEALLEFGTLNDLTKWLAEQPRSNA